MRRLIETLLRDAPISPQEKTAFGHVLSKKEPERSECVALLAYVHVRALGVEWNRAMVLYDLVARLQSLNDPVHRSSVSELFVWDGAAEFWPVPSSYLLTSSTEAHRVLMLIPVAGFDRNIEERLERLGRADMAKLN